MRAVRRMLGVLQAEWVALLLVLLLVLLLLPGLECPMPALASSMPRLASSMPDLECPRLR